MGEWSKSPQARAEPKSLDYSFRGYFRSNTDCYFRLFLCIFCVESYTLPSAQMFPLSMNKSHNCSFFVVRQICGKNSD